MYAIWELATRGCSIINSWSIQSKDIAITRTMKAVYSFLFVGFTTAALIQYDFDCFPIASKAKCILILIIRI